MGCGTESLNAQYSTGGGKIGKGAKIFFIFCSPQEKCVPLLNFCVSPQECFSVPQNTRIPQRLTKKTIKSVFIGNLTWTTHLSYQTTHAWAVCKRVFPQLLLNTWEVISNRKVTLVCVWCTKGWRGFRSCPCVLLILWNLGLFVVQEYVQGKRYSTLWKRKFQTKRL